MSETEDMVELLPCPFCGAKASMNYDDASDYSVFWYYYVSCDSQPCSGTGPYRRDRAEAADLWNRRAALSPTGGQKL